MMKKEVRNVLETLSDREKRVLILRFGLDDGQPKTLEEVGHEFNVTRERIRQIEATALRKLRHPSRSQRLKEFVQQQYVDMTRIEKWWNLNLSLMSDKGTYNHKSESAGAKSNERS